MECGNARPSKSAVALVAFAPGRTNDRVQTARIGLFGVMSYSVVQRAREIGVRMALGARRIDIFNLIVREGMLLTGVGLGAGIVAALAITRLISGLLFGISANDFSTFAILSGLLAIVAFLACWWPAHRASKVDPIITLRAE